MAEQMLINDPNNPAFGPAGGNAQNVFAYNQGQQPIGATALNAGQQAPWLMRAASGTAQLFPGMQSLKAYAAYTAGFRMIKQQRTILEGPKGFLVDNPKAGQLLQPKKILQTAESMEDLPKSSLIRPWRGTDFNPRNIFRYRSRERMIKYHGGGLADVSLNPFDKTSPKILDPNMAGRLSTQARLGRMKSFTPDTGQNVLDYVKATNPEVASQIESAGGLTTARDASYALGMASKTSAGQYMSGFMHQAKFGGNVTEPLMTEANIPGIISERSGIEASAKFIAGREASALGREAMNRGTGTVIKEQIAKKTAEKVAAAGGKEAIEKAGVEVGLSVAEKFGITAGTIGAEGTAAIADLWNPIGWVLLAKTIWDTAKAVGTLTNQLIMRPLAGAIEKGARSFIGQGTKAPFGMGYIDNEVAATSRARGVAAIQNSRLNARSALGAEGSLLHARFG